MVLPMTREEILVEMLQEAIVAEERMYKMVEEKIALYRLACRDVWYYQNKLAIERGDISED